MLYESFYQKNVTINRPHLTILEITQEKIKHQMTLVIKANLSPQPSSMKIRNQSDKLCEEHHLSVIDLETQKEINKIKKRKFVNWYDWNEDKKGNSYKSRLQFDIDRA
ncbi:MAG TPA: hypothetical protein K8W13_03610 [Enterococcus columbae]|nr:hypothetical protein [Enterococcus columbae]